jgi:hypothetical protein
LRGYVVEVLVRCVEFVFESSHAYSFSPC